MSKQTNLCALHGLQQVGQSVFEGADEHPAELLKQSTETRNSCPETHTHTSHISYSLYIHHIYHTYIISVLLVMFCSELE